jgi:hypothetical protein
MLAEVRSVLDRAGLLLQHDAQWPSVTSIVAGEVVRGSWWGHAAGHAIFGVLEALHDEVACPKLLGGKVTLVHRRLWPALAAMGGAGEAWQLRGQKEDAADVLELVEAEGEIRADDIELAPDCRTISAIVTDLERRLLLVTDQEHTESGKHVRVLRSWRRFARPLGRLPAPAAARGELEDAVERFGGRDALRLLPWR